MDQAQKKRNGSEDSNCLTPKVVNNAPNERQSWEMVRGVRKTPRVKVETLSARDEGRIRCRKYYMKSSLTRRCLGEIGVLDGSGVFKSLQKRDTCRDTKAEHKQRNRNPVAARRA